MEALRVGEEAFQRSHEPIHSDPKKRPDLRVLPGGKTELSAEEFDEVEEAKRMLREEIVPKLEENNWRLAIAKAKAREEGIEKEELRAFIAQGITEDIQNMESIILRGEPKQQISEPVQEVSPEKKGFEENEINSLIIRSTPEIQKYFKETYGLDIDANGILVGEDTTPPTLSFTHPDIRKISALLGELQHRANQQHNKE